MNWALRNDDKCLHDWATYVALLFFGGELDYSAAVCPPDALPNSPQVASKGVGSFKVSRLFDAVGRGARGAACAPTYAEATSNATPNLLL